MIRRLRRLRTLTRRLLAGEPTVRSYRRLAYLCMAMAAVAIAAAGWDVVLWNQNRSQDARLDAILTARELANQAQCRSAIASTQLANRIVSVIRDDLYYRADITQRLVDASPDDPGNSERLATVVFYRAKASLLPEFKAPSCQK